MSNEKVLFVITTWHETKPLTLKLLAESIATAALQHTDDTFTLDIHVYYDEANDPITMKTLLAAIAKTNGKVQAIPYPVANIGRDGYKFQRIWEDHSGTYDYLFFGNADDLWMPTRIIDTLRIFRAKPETALILNGYEFVDYVKSLDHPSITPMYLQILPNFGINAGYPSCWALNTKVLSLMNTRVLEEEYGGSYDAVFIMQTIARQPVISFMRPLVIYNYRPGSQCFSLPNFTDTQRKYIDYAQKIVKGDEFNFSYLGEYEWQHL